MNMGSQQQFSLRWKNHQTNLLDVFDQLLQNEAFVDVTLACEGVSIKAHKMVLSACSPYFQNLFIENPCNHPIVILKDIKFEELKAIIDFMYKGEVNVSQEQLSTLLRTAEMLQIKGLNEVMGTYCNDSDSSEDEDKDSCDGNSKNNEVSETTSPLKKRRKITKFNNDETSENNVIGDTTNMLPQEDETKNNTSNDSEQHNENIILDIDKMSKSSSVESRSQSTLEVKPSLEFLPKSSETSSHNSAIYLPNIADWVKQHFPSIKSTSHQDKSNPQENITGFKCTFCSKIFTDSESLVEHSSLHLHRFQCEVCGTCFANQRDLRRHEHRHIPIHFRKPQFECEECGKRFHNQGSLINHRNVHKERFKCDLCGHCSQSKVMLEKHIRIHL